MARVNVYLPDELAAEVRRNDLNLSALTQNAAREALAGRGVKPKGTPMDPASQEKIDYLTTQFDAVRAEFDDRAKAGVLTDVKAKTVLVNLQGIAQALESASFERL